MDTYRENTIVFIVGAIAPRRNGRTGPGPIGRRFILAPKLEDIMRDYLNRLRARGELLVVERESFPLVDLRVDFDPQPLVQLRWLWENYEPSAKLYVERAINPDGAPGAA